jgi:HEAT repeat protein/cyclophilin family peptidyl-prolyl cis-trans isomerase
MGACYDLASMAATRIAEKTPGPPSEVTGRFALMWPARCSPRTLLGRRASVRCCVVAAAACVSSCATAPPPQPVVTPEMTMSWILRLEDQRTLRDTTPPIVPAPQAGRPRSLAPPPPPPPDLVRQLADGDRRMRRRAALAVGRVGLPEGVPPLVTLLQSDPEPEVRQVAAFALGLIADRRAIGPLQQALGDPSPLVVGRAAEALGLIGDPASAAAIGRMVAAQLQTGSVARLAPDETGSLVDPSAEAFRLGVCALARLGTYEPLAAAVLGADGQPLVRWWPVAFALQHVDDKRALAALATLAGSEGSYVRAFAARGLGATGDRAATPALVGLVDLANLSSGPTIEAIRALGRTGDPRSVPILLKVVAASTTDPTVRAEAITALAGTGTAGNQDILLDLLSDPSPIVRAAAFSTLARVDADTFVTVLSGLDPDAHWSVRAALASALGTLDGARALPRLMAMLADSDARVVPFVLAALTKVRAPDIGTLLIDRLTSDDVVVRASAAANLGEVRPARGAEALAAAYAFGERDASYTARAAALAALATYGASAAPTLRAALGDKDWAVRVRAAELLRQVDPAADAARMIRPAPTGRQPAAYDARQLTAPAVSPHVYIDTDNGTIEIELAVLDAPLTCDTFMTLARKGYFDGLSFHRVVPDFVVQSGDPRGDGEGGPGFTLRDELNERPYLRGTVGLARDWRDTGGGQFFITHGPQPRLDARYTVFGQVVSGMEVVDRVTQWDVIRRVRVWDGGQVSVR